MRARILALPFCHVKLKAAKPKDPAYPTELKCWGDHLRKRRLNLGLLQKQVAKQIGCNTASIVNWEKGYRHPDIRFIPAIIAFLRYNPIPKPEGIPAQLRWARGCLGWSQVEAAMFLGCDESSVSAWELGEHRPIRESLRKIEKLLLKTRSSG
jgi:transcriptional regulator with XRE-family HTH domain